MTSLSPLLQAPMVIQLHAFAALLALALGPVALWRRRRDRWHKVTGYVWITAMAATALSSFWIHSMPMIGPFGPIHALSLWTLCSLTWGLTEAIRGNHQGHARIMRSLYLFGLSAAAIFTLLPGRIMHRVLFGEDTQAGLFLIAALIATGLWLYRRNRRFDVRRNA